MPNTLLEADFLTVDLKSIYNRTAQTNAGETDNSAASSEQPNSTEKVDAADTKLMQVLKDSGIEDADVIKKLLALGSYFKKAIEVLGNKATPGTGANPILGFVAQSKVQENFIKTGLLNINSFKAIYNAVAKNLVADSEFFAINDYNIIYCKDLYRKPAKEIEEYLRLQRTILKPSATKYTTDDLIKNKKVFLKATDETSTNLPAMLNAKLNELSLAERIEDEFDERETAVRLDNEKQEDIVNKLADSQGKIPNAIAFATLLSLVVSTNNAKVKSALKDPRFKDVHNEQLVMAISSLAGKSLLPKGRMRTEDIESLAVKIIAKLN